jgi:hypothetical protein
MAAAAGDLAGREAALRKRNAEIDSSLREAVERTTTTLLPAQTTPTRSPGRPSTLSPQVRAAAAASAENRAKKQLSHDLEEVATSDSGPVASNPKGSVSARTNITRSRPSTGPATRSIPGEDCELRNDVKYFIPVQS